MNLAKKKELAAKTLKVGKGRIIFNMENLSDIKEAITRQDIKGLNQEGIITIRPVKGRKKIKRRKIRRGPGKIKKKVNNRKQVYVKITRKLRKYLMELRNRGVVDRELYWDLRKKIRMRNFKSKANFKEYLKSVEVDFDKVVKNDKISSTSENKKKVEKKDTKKTDNKDNEKTKQ